MSRTGDGKALPPGSAFARDDGSVHAEFAQLLTRYRDGSVDLRGVVEALAGERLLVPIMANAEVIADDGHGHAVDREASAGVVAVATPDGRQALPVFTSVDAMRAWRREARPVPVAAPRAALSAVSEGWAVVVVDPAGPVPVVLPRPAVWALAQGHQWLPAVVGGVVEPDVADALVAAVVGIRHVVEVTAIPGQRAEIALKLSLTAGLNRVGLDQVLAEVNTALAASTVASERVDSLELRIGAAS